jgi:hypothetical protein
MNNAAELDDREEICQRFDTIPLLLRDTNAAVEMIT